MGERLVAALQELSIDQSTAAPSSEAAEGEPMIQELKTASGLQGIERLSVSSSSDESAPSPEAGKRQRVSSADDEFSSNSTSEETGNSEESEKYNIKLQNTESPVMKRKIGRPRWKDNIPGFHLQKVLGEGTFSKVFLATKANDKRKVAVKVYKEKHTMKVHEELQLCHRVNSLAAEAKPLFTQLLEWNCRVKRPYLVFECLGMDLRTFMDYKDDEDILPPHQLRSIFFQLSKALEYLHDDDILHTDIKPENIVFAEYDPLHKNCYYDDQDVLVVTSTKIKLIDFGNACYAPKPLKGKASALVYRAPEIIMEFKWHKPIDIWSTACVVIELLTGITLFDYSTDLKVLTAQLALFPETSSRFLEDVSPFLQKNALEYYHEKKRLNVFPYELLMRGFASHNNDLLRDLLDRMFVVHQRQRISIKQVLNHRYFRGLELHSQN